MQADQDYNELKNQLAHVLWIGGGTDAGKTTVAEAVVARHGFEYYNFDRHERSHSDRRAAAGDFDGETKNPFEMTPDELWLDSEPEDMAAGVVRGWSRRVKYAIEDLLELSTQKMIIAEGPGFFPEVMAPLLASRHQAIWFVPEAHFKRKIAVQREKPSVRFETRDPFRAQENIIARDLLVAEHVKQQAVAHRLK